MDKKGITDAVARLRDMNAAFEEIDRLRKREAELLAAGDRLESQLCEAARERDRLRLTDAEREALQWCLGWCEGLNEKKYATLRGLLDRTQTVEK